MRSLLTLLLIPAAAMAQGQMPTEFPADAAPIAADALRERLAGKVFNVQPFTGPSWRLEYKPNGYAFLDTSAGFRDTGKWRAEDSKLCSDWQKATSGCGEVRVKGDSIYIKRSSNGEVVTFSQR